MKKQLLFFFQCLILTASFAQPAELLIKKGPGGSYLEHKAAAKEGLFPLGRLYNVHPRHIAAFNNLEFNKGLSINQLIKIPLTDTNFNQSDNKGLPVFYKTIGKETLANISIKYNKVQLKKLREWNQLTDDNISADSKLIIGFLITGEVQENVVAKAEKKTEPVLPPVTEKKEIVKEEKKNDTESKKEEEKKTEPVIKKENPLVVKEEPKKNAPEIVIKEMKPDESEGGFFRNYFNQQVKQFPVTKEQTLTSSVFKSANGWQDAKYYLLINGVEPGTIIKITNPANNKSVYAKVLYGMEGIRQGEGLDIRISDATATALAITETEKFVVKVNY